MNRYRTAFFLLVLPAILSSFIPSLHAQQMEVRIVTLTSPVNPGNNVTLSVQTAPQASCRITLPYKLGQKKGARLAPTAADSNGLVSWTWRLVPGSISGKWPITVTCTSGGRQGTLKTFLVVR